MQVSLRRGRAKIQTFIKQIELVICIDAKMIIANASW